jgi:hypothetical protein
MSRDVGDLVELAEELRERGMSLASAAQDRVEPEWSEQAFQAIVTAARRQSTVHVDDIWPKVAPPHHYNAWGSVWMRAIKRGIIAKTDGRRHSIAPRKHKHEYPIYRSLIVGNA